MSLRPPPPFPADASGRRHRERRGRRRGKEGQKILESVKAHRHQPLRPDNTQRAAQHQISSEEHRKGKGKEKPGRSPKTRARGRAGAQQQQQQHHPGFRGDKYPRAS
ncbi:hypothetical protein LY78DRAFT_652425 [Colletotrichum sublineola]|nr:hypothetical protein LY78DRAFT_652425 [Colletotrichum sublineola]